MLLFYFLIGLGTEKERIFFGRENTQKNFGKDNTRGILAERITEERAEKEFLAEIHTRAIFF